MAVLPPLFPSICSLSELIFEPAGLDFQSDSCPTSRISTMAKPHRLIKKANHGSRPANSKARRLKRAKVRT
jgi:hypothetical protein